MNELLFNKNIRLKTTTWLAGSTGFHVVLMSIFLSHSGKKTNKCLKLADSGFMRLAVIAIFGFLKIGQQHTDREHLVLFFF